MLWLNIHLTGERDYQYLHTTWTWSIYVRSRRKSKPVCGPISITLGDSPTVCAWLVCKRENCPRFLLKGKVQDTPWAQCLGWTRGAAPGKLPCGGNVWPLVGLAPQGRGWWRRPRCSFPPSAEKNWDGMGFFSLPWFHKLISSTNSYSNSSSDVNDELITWHWKEDKLTENTS